MFKFILKRMYQGIMTLWFIVTITFFIMHNLPGDPFVSEKEISPIVRQKLLEKYNLDKPLHLQYVLYMKELVKGNLAISMKYKNRSVSEVIKKSFGYSLDLAINSISFALALGLLIGIISALNRGKFIDKFSIILVIIGISVPSFVLSGILRLIFSEWLNILPNARYVSFKHKILPSVVAALGPLSMISRMTRASMIEVLSQDYIKTAKAKGLPNYMIIWKHCLKNAILPIISYVGQVFANIAAGSFIIERIFVIPGLGSHYVESIENQDYTMTLGLTIFYSIILVSVFTVVDIIYMLLDPKIKFNKESGE